jgi:hypothetical protein
MNGAVILRSGTKPDCGGIAPAQRRVWAMDRGTMRLMAIAAVFCAALAGGTAGAADMTVPLHPAAAPLWQAAGIRGLNPDPQGPLAGAFGGCRDRGSLLSPVTVVERLRAQGYYAVRDLRFQPVTVSTGSRPVGVYTATASHGFGIVRWRLSIDPCSGRVLKARELPATRYH